MGEGTACSVATCSIGDAHKKFKCKANSSGTGFVPVVIITEQLHSTNCNKVVVKLRSMPAGRDLVLLLQGKPLNVWVSVLMEPLSPSHSVKKQLSWS